MWTTSSPFLFNTTFQPFTFHPFFPFQIEWDRERVREGEEWIKSSTRTIHRWPFSQPSILFFPLPWNHFNEMNSLLPPANLAPSSHFLTIVSHFLSLSSPFTLKDKRSPNIHLDFDSNRLKQPIQTVWKWSMGSIKPISILFLNQNYTFTIKL